MGRMAHIRIKLPARSPEVYLAWMAFWREVEDAMLRWPGVEAVASLDRAPFLHHATARLLAGLGASIASASREAQRQGAAQVFPLIYGDPSQLLKGVRYMERRAEWMSRPGVLETMGIKEPAVEVVALQAAVIEAVRHEATRAVAGEGQADQ
jgi:hypothetical protein